MDDLTENELKLLEDMQLRESQLRNINTVMRGSITPKKLKRMEEDVLPGYLVRARNARSKAEAMMRKKGLMPKN